jgi:hypothetical protein
MQVCEQDVHEAMKADDSVWSSLPLVGEDGIQRLDGVPVLELRNCPCGSTLARPLCPCPPGEGEEVH